jgi:glycerophosphoryl diester phosphodiesterase
MPELIAHRGAAFDAPENSLQALELAIQQGADRLEFDVQLTRDGVPVLCHDSTTQRTTDQRLEIEFVTLAELQVARLANGEPIPTLEDVLRLAVGRVELDIEVKSSLPAVVPAVLELLRDVGAGNDPFITTFDPATLLALAKAGFDGRRGLLIGSRSLHVRQRYYEAWPIRTMEAVRATDLVIHHLLLHAPLRQALKRRHYGHWLWTAMEDEQKPTVQRRQLYERLERSSARGVIVARVDEARQSIRPLAQTP